jgi:hypothetical protein
MPTLMLIGVVLFFGGGLVFLALLFASGGTARSRQFAVIAELLDGRRGRGKRRLVLAALLLMATGAISLFAGVAAMDARRANHCQDYCTASGFERGTIGPSQDRRPESRFVACTCSGGIAEPLERRADTLP